MLLGCSCGRLPASPSSACAGRPGTEKKNKQCSGTALASRALHVRFGFEISSQLSNSSKRIIFISSPRHGRRTESIGIGRPTAATANCSVDRSMSLSPAGGRVGGDDSTVASSGATGRQAGHRGQYCMRQLSGCLLPPSDGRGACPDASNSRGVPCRPLTPSDQPGRRVFIEPQQLFLLANY